MSSSCYRKAIVWRPSRYRQISPPVKFRRHRTSVIFLCSRKCVSRCRRVHCRQKCKNARAQSIVHRHNRAPFISLMSNPKELYPRSQTPGPRSTSTAQNDSTVPSARGRDRLTINFLAHGAGQSPAAIPAHMQQYSRTRTTSNIDAAELRRANARSNSSNTNMAVNNALFDPRGRAYHLEVIQHPEKSAEFGSAVLSRLPLAPPLIVQLTVRDSTGTPVRADNELPFLIAHLSLYSGDGSRALDVFGGHQRPPHQPSAHQLLYGTLVSSPQCYRNMQNHPGLYFIFPDVSVRIKGRYTLMVKLMRISRAGATGVIGAGEQGEVLARAMTRPFDVISQINYVAPPLTPLTQYFLQQGAGMQAFASTAQNPRPQF